MRWNRCLLVTLAAVCSQAALAFPDRPITIVSGFGPGGSTELAARILSDRMAQEIGSNTRFVIEYRPGAAGTQASEWLKAQQPDGHTIMITETGAAAVAPIAMESGTQYDPVADFTQIGVISTPPSILIATPSFAAQTGAAALAQLRAAPPGSIAFATVGTGGSQHLRQEVLASILGTRFAHRPYQSGALALQSVAAGETQMSLAAIATAAAAVREGKVQGLAMTGAQRFALFPDIPTLAELGIAGFEDAGFFMLIAPAGMPEPITNTLNRALNAALADPAVRERLVSAGHDPMRGPNAPADARAFMARQLELYRSMAQRAGVRLQ